jgi:hypothetical protein
MLGHILIEYAQELEAFLKTGDSTSTGWSKDDGSGESIGHESGRKIVEILRSNPDKAYLALPCYILYH